MSLRGPRRTELNSSFFFSVKLKKDEIYIERKIYKGFPEKRNPVSLAMRRRKGKRICSLQCFPCLFLFFCFFFPLLFPVSVWFLVCALSGREFGVCSLWPVVSLLFYCSLLPDSYSPGSGFGPLL